MYDELKNAIREHLGTEKMSQEEGRKLIRQCRISAGKFLKNKSEVAELYLNHEAAIKDYLEVHGETISDIEDAVVFVFETACEEMEEEAAIVDEFSEYDDEAEHSE